MQAHLCFSSSKGSKTSYTKWIRIKHRGRPQALIDITPVSRSIGFAD